MEQFYVYLNWVAAGHSACIHRGGCSHCREGQGNHPGTGNENGKWIEKSFDSIEGAKAAALHELPTATIRLCGHCLPSARTTMD